MPLLALLLAGCACLWLGYALYGSFLRRFFELKDNAPTPAHVSCDNKDFVPANKWYLLGQHLSAIAAAGPIVGPILAGMWFGWLPTFAWLIVGGIFIGGVHDVASLVASVRHQGKSIAQIIRVYMSRRAYVLFLLFCGFPSFISSFLLPTLQHLPSLIPISVLRLHLHPCFILHLPS